MKSLNDFGELLQEHNRAVELALMLPEFIVTSDSGNGHDHPSKLVAPYS